MTIERLTTEDFIAPSRIDPALIETDELASRKDEWDRAARETPHGQPIELPGRR
jgi:hypothetical protein